MWLFTASGFFSIVQKPNETHLTVRARVRSDLDQLRARYLPELSKTAVLADSDDKYRVTVARTALANAMAAIVMDLNEANFKAAVEHDQDHAREAIYADVWHGLYDGLPKLDAATPATRRSQPASARRSR